MRLELARKILEVAARVAAFQEPNELLSDREASNLFMRHERDAAELSRLFFAAITQWLLERAAATVGAEAQRANGKLVKESGVVTHYFSSSVWTDRYPDGAIRVTLGNNHWDIAPAEGRKVQKQLKKDLAAIEKALTLAEQLEAQDGKQD